MCCTHTYDIYLNLGDEPSEHRSKCEEITGERDRRDDDVSPRQALLEEIFQRTLNSIGGALPSEL